MNRKLDEIHRKEIYVHAEHSAIKNKIYKWQQIQYLQRCEEIVQHNGCELIGVRGDAVWRHWRQF